MISKEHLIELLKENEVFLEGDFTLSSGKKSNYYINMKKAIKDIQENGGKVVRAFVVVDRQEGAIEAFEKEGITLEPLITVNEFFD